MFSFIKNRGGVGRSLSRHETVERLNPLLDRHNRLMYACDHVIGRLSDRDAAESLEAHQRSSRIGIAKLSETIVSNAGTPPLGTDIRPDEISLGSDDDEMLTRLRDVEQAYNDALRAELKLRHHMRTFAILNHVLADSDRRLDALERIATESKKKTPARA